jgi:hypothetical protein
LVNPTVVEIFTPCADREAFDSVGPLQGFYLKSWIFLLFFSYNRDLPYFDYFEFSWCLLGSPRAAVKPPNILKIVVFNFITWYKNIRNTPILKINNKTLLSGQPLRPKEAFTYDVIFQIARFDGLEDDVISMSLLAEALIVLNLKREKVKIKWNQASRNSTDTIVVWRKLPFEVGRTSENPRQLDVINFYGFKP